MTSVRGTRNVVVRDVERAPLETVDRLAPLGTSTVHEAIGRRGYLGPHITPIQKGIQVAGTAIKRGELVIIHLAGANRDPEVFDSPDEFQLDRVRDRARGSGSALAFGAGTHFCLGSHLAHAELEVALDVVLRLLPGLRLAPDAEVTARGAIFRGPRKLPVRFDA